MDAKFCDCGPNLFGGIGMMGIVETQNIASLHYHIPLRHCISIRHRVSLHFPVLFRCEKNVATYDARPCAATCKFSKNTMFEISTKMHDISTSAFDNIQILYPRIMDAIFDNCRDAIFCVSALPRKNGRKIFRPYNFFCSENTFSFKIKNSCKKNESNCRSQKKGWQRATFPRS